jgi:hypothetical protein
MNDFETVTVEVPVRPYDRSTGVLSWHDNDEDISIRIDLDKNTVAIQGNQKGLRGLARDLLTLAQDDVPLGRNLYLMSMGQAPTLTSGSASLHISRR